MKINHAFKSRKTNPIKPNFKRHTAKVGNVFYARRMKASRTSPRGSALMMHREVLKVPDYLFVDHINHNGLDNRKANLRPATKTQNGRNRRKVNIQRYLSRYKGPGWYGRKKKWGVKIMVDGKSIFLGYFDDEIKAAKAYDTAAKKYFGEFACLNLSQDTKPEPVRRLVRRRANDPSSAAVAKPLPLRRVEVGILGKGGTTPQKNITANSHL